MLDFHKNLLNVGHRSHHEDNSSDIHLTYMEQQPFCCPPCAVENDIIYVPGPQNAKLSGS